MFHCLFYDLFHGNVNDSFVLCRIIRSCIESFFLDFGNCSYHDNAYVTSRALHIVNTVHANATFSLLEGFFKHQVCSMLILKT